MDLITIGEAARLLGVNASALRYYEQRGLVRPTDRRQGRRMYGRQELRRLAFVQLAQRLGIPLDTAGAVLDEPGETWRGTVAEQIEELDRLIARAQDAREYLVHALACPTEHPASECPHMIGALDRLLDGHTFAQIAADHRRGS